MAEYEDEATEAVKTLVQANRMNRAAYEDAVVRHSLLGQLLEAVVDGCEADVTSLLGNPAVLDDIMSLGIDAKDVLAAVVAVRRA